MDGIATATGAADEARHRPTNPASGHLGPDDADAADRIRAGIAPPGHSGATAPDPLLDPPSPDAVVAVSLRHDAAPEERARRHETALRARHAAEVARLRAALRAMEEAHAAEVARLRAEHAADTAGLRRAVEAQRRAPDTARTGAERSGGSEDGAAPGLRARQPATKPFMGADLIAAVRALLPAGAASLSRLRGAALPPPR